MDRHAGARRVLHSSRSGGRWIVGHRVVSVARRQLDATWGRAGRCISSQIGVGIAVGALTCYAPVIAWAKLNVSLSGARSCSMVATR